MVFWKPGWWLIALTRNCIPYFVLLVLSPALPSVPGLLVPLEVSVVPVLGPLRCGFLDAFCF